MYALSSTAGLNTQVPTIEQVAAALGQHLHDMAGDGPIHWRIRTPACAEHLGFVELNSMPSDPQFLADTVAEVTANLRAAADHVGVTVK